MIWAALALIVLIFGAVVLVGAPYVPSHKKQIERAFSELYRLKKSDHLVDVGSGDGVVLRVAARRSVGSTGYELNPFLVLISRLLNQRYKKLSQVKFADYRSVKFPDQTTVVYAFSTSRHIDRLVEHIKSEAKRLDRELWFVSYGFEPSGLKPSAKVGAHSLYKINQG